MAGKEKIEMLLKPRILVTADYYQGNKDIKDNRVKVGDIFMNQAPQQNIVWRRVIQGQWDNETIHNPQQYPNLFKPLEWWQERELVEMPEYLRMNHQSNCIMKALRHNVKATHGLGFENEEGKIKSYINYTPTTCDEFNDYINSKK